MDGRSAHSESVTGSVLAACCPDPDLYISKLLRCKRLTEDGNKFVNWAHSHPHLKVVEQQIPEGVFPDGINAKLADVKVFSKGPDDIVYDKNEELREKVARGNSFLQLDGQPWQCVIYALKKFTGGMGDDDDRSGGGDNTVWKQYFTKSLDEATSVISLKKANGEAAHMSCIKINQVHYICIGSKNVHMIIRKRSDIDKYTGGRYQVAAWIATTVLEFLESLCKHRVIRLLDFLDETRLTVVLEILNPHHQHVEDLSYLGDKCALKFITWTSTDLAAKNELCVLPPDIAIKVASHLGFDTVAYEEISAAEAETHMLQIRKQYGFEGEVFYYLDGKRNVIGLLKKKTAWYIICRAIREKVRNALTSKKTFDQMDTRRRIMKRIREIQTWLNLCRHSTQQWQELGAAYLDWVVEKRRQGSVTPQDVADMFPVTWTRFLKDKQLSDEVVYSESVAS